MKKQGMKGLLCLLLILLFLISSAGAASAEGEERRADEIYMSLKDPEGRPLCVAKYGDTRSFPENSVEGVLAAAELGADLVLVSVRRTADNFIVLMKDDTLSRMCADELGRPVNKKLSQVSRSELSAYRLRSGKGRLYESVTDCAVPTLQETVEKLDGRALLLIEGGWAFRDEIYAVLANADALRYAVILADGDKKETASWLAGKEVMPLVLGSSGGGLAKSYVSGTLSAGAVGVLLSAKNPYSSVFGGGVQDKFRDAGRAVADMTEPLLCGRREDNAKGWNDLSRRGFSALITGDPAGLLDYYARVDAGREKLLASLAAAQEIDLALCGTKSANALKKTMAEAKKLAVSSRSEEELTEMDYRLRAAMDGLLDRSQDSGGRTFTRGRIAAVVLTLPLLILIEVVFDRARRKKAAQRRRTEHKINPR